MSLFRSATVLGLLAIAGCAAASDTADASSSDLSVNGMTAFAHVSSALSDEVGDINSRQTAIVNVNAHTPGATIASMVPAKNVTTVAARGATPRGLEGVYWMRGNPLADYLLSFANMHWTNANGTPYGYLSISAPGSFAFKRKVVAEGAVDGDYTFLPEICRVPRNDRTLARIANSPSTYDENNYRRSIADDFAAMAGETPVDAARAEQWVSDVQTAGQLAVDGPELLATAHDTHAVYESTWNASFTEASVQVVFVATAPGILRSLLPPFRVPVPSYFGSFSLAPHLDGDRDVFVRKTYLVGTKSPNYYFLTRIVDANGRELPHYKEFLQCVQERSGGEILKVLAPQ